MRSFAPLRPGDLIAVVAPSGPFPEDRLARGVAVLRARGYEVREGASLRSTHRYLAARDEARSTDLIDAFEDEEVRAIFAARGGYGAMRLLPTLPIAKFAASGKPLVGFSDVTALHLALQRHGARSVHGPVVTRLAEEPPEAIDRLFSLLERGEAPPPITGRELVAGRASGRLVGGCLSIVSRLVGTPYLPDLSGCVLLLEDVGEKPYRLDRMWTHLRLAGVLDGLAGVVLGDLTSCEEPGADYTARDVLEELVGALGKPALAGLAIGHGPTNLAVPLGARVRLEDGALFFDEGLGT